MFSFQTIAVITSGGDCPGMNPAVRGVVRIAINKYGARVIGVRDGFSGLVRCARHIKEGRLSIEKLQHDLASDVGACGLLQPEQDLIDLDHDSVSGLSSQGGSVLGAGRSREFLDPSVRQAVIALLSNLKVMGLVVIGGDGSAAGAAAIAAESDLRVAVVPATIDNDMWQTDMALGTDTATNTIIDAAERCGDTARAHHRIHVLQVMGRDCGQLAQRGALGAGAEIVVTPERGRLTSDKLHGIAGRLEVSMGHGHRHAIVIVAEGVKTDPSPDNCPAQTLGRYLELYFQRPDSIVPELEVRVTVLCHVQRGGRPSAADRILAARFAKAAVDVMLAEEARSGITVLRNGSVTVSPFGEASSPSQDKMRIELYELQKTLSKRVIPSLAIATSDAAASYG